MWSTTFSGVQMPGSALSVGRLNAAWCLVRLVVAQGPIGVDDACTICRMRTQYEPSVTTDGLGIALRAQLLRGDSDGALVEGPRLSRGVDFTAPCPSDEHYRLMLREYIRAVRPAWATLAVAGAENLRAYLDDLKRECFDAARLWDYADSHVADWWQEMRDVVAGWEVDHRKEVGSTAEQLTVAHEQQRLSRAGRADLARRVVWAAAESDVYGFDVRSFVCGLEKQGGAGRPDAELLVEVKATSASGHPKMRFFLTRNEWDVALSGTSRYVFYLWAKVKPSADSAIGPFVLEPSSVLSLLPVTVSEDADWTECSVEVVLPVE